MESCILSFILLCLGWVSMIIDNIETDMELNKFMLEADLLVCVHVSSVLGREWPGNGLIWIQLMIERNFELRCFLWGFYH